MKLQPYYSKEKTPSYPSFLGHFILTKNDLSQLINWDLYIHNGWKLYANKLPVIRLIDEQEKEIGWCLGHPIDIASNVYLDKPVNQVVYSGHPDIKNWSGRFLIILFFGEELQIYPDASASLSIVYHKELRSISSNPHLFGLLGKRYWDEEIIQAFHMPQSGLWYPFGITPFRQVERLLPNHTLSTTNFESLRCWPASLDDLQPIDAQEGIEKISQILSNTFEIVLERYPIYLSLTAGRDSRMLLAAAKPHLDECSFFTFTDGYENVDTHLAKILADRFELNHSFLKIIKASEAEKTEWLYYCGHGLGGAILEIHPTLKQLKPDRVVLPGMAGEVGRAFYWNKSDLGKKKSNISASDLIARANLPVHHFVTNKAKDWLKGLEDFSNTQVLDLFYIEQRLGCWASLSHYGNRHSVLEFSPLSQREIFSAMMRLPETYRYNQELANDLCSYYWPELLQVPFNEYIGIKNIPYKAKLVIKPFVKNILAMIKRYRVAR